MGVRAMSAAPSIASQLSALTTALPMLETVAYPASNYKWCYSECQKFVGALAAGLHEVGLKQGDALAVWMPDNTAEALVTKLVAARLGLVLVEIDVGVSDPTDLRTILNENSVKNMIFDLEADDRYNMNILKEVMPELNHYDDQFGMPFRSREVPSMKLLVHVNFEIVPAVQNLRFLMSFSAEHTLPDVPASVDTPRYIKYDAAPEGKAVKGKLMTEKELLESNSWPVVSAMLSKTHVTIA